MRTVVVVLASLVVVGMLIVPGSVSAKTLSIEVEDRTGDIAAAYDYTTYDYAALLGDNTPIVQAGYFDMTLFRFSLKKDTYTFGMEMAADLPKEGDPLPSGIKLIRYTLWLDEESWDWVSDIVDYYMVVLWYDGTSYSAELLEWPTKVAITSLSFTVEGPRFDVEFPTSWMEGIESFWLFPAVNAFHSQNPEIEVWPDLLDYDPDAPDQEYTSVRWPPSEP